MRSAIAGAITNCPWRFFQKALEINPSSAWAHGFCGWAHLYAGAPDSAVDHFHAALRLSPLDRMIFLFQSGIALAFTMIARHEDAVAWARKSIEGQPSWTAAYRPLIASLMHLGRDAEAGAAVRAMLAIQPAYTIALSARPYRDSPGKTLYIEGLRKAGLPE